MENLKQRLAKLKLESQDDQNMLNDILEEVKAAHLSKDMLVPLLRVLENNPSYHFGTPGTIVHTIEKIYIIDKEDEEYFNLLIQSAERVPTEYNLWLMNRIMNTFEEKSQIEKGLTVFRKVVHETTNDSLREIVQEFIENFDE